MSSNQVRTGGCQCGAVRYRIVGEPFILVICHCTQCQRQSGSAFGMSLIVRNEQLEVTGKLKTFARPSELGQEVVCAFCPECGTRIHHRPKKAPDTTNVKAGTLDDTTCLEPQLQVWTRDKQPWVSLACPIPDVATQPQ
ncbi:MAG: GFA family protein [Myxococcales bacterium]|nr:GFA family protein [Myxococcales bacterium]MDD9972192.1 GFA family protein [Myxococcales bacterium]